MAWQGRAVESQARVGLEPQTLCYPQQGCAAKVVFIGVAVCGCSMDRGRAGRGSRRICNKNNRLGAIAADTPGQLQGRQKQQQNWEARTLFCMVQVQHSGSSAA